uniref:Uncharacterized protein n=1 Tax=Beihai levi-like virus 30 TaxID=1922417 RepID=A0A1L3KIJ2_9VIRU|nr:hypothetical protein [Beihai levi-like virus 30]
MTIVKILDTTSDDVNTALETDSSGYQNTWDRLSAFRELSPNKKQYIFPDHTSDMPHHVTVTSALPVPRKGNPGTMKATVNYHRTVIADAGLPTERRVPQVVKIDTSFPVGTDALSMLVAICQATTLLSPTSTLTFEVMRDLVGRGILPKS